ncbi:hypothetical protein GCM10007937_51200 [Mesorhizobium albiziae]|nr:hypothetical protein GCM10007937_51200 [Mesorhizobium albiziae]
MADFMRDDVEIQAEGMDGPVGRAMNSYLQEAVSHEGILYEIALQNQLELVEVAGEVPFDWMAEIALPDIERSPYDTEKVRCLKFRTFNLDAIEMAVGIGEGRRKGRAGPRRQDIGGIAEPILGKAIGCPLADRIDDIHAIVGRAGAYRASGR